MGARLVGVIGPRRDQDGRRWTVGAVNARDLKRDGRAYVKGAYRKSDVTLRIEVKGGVGEINLERSDSSPVV
jgi:hypothetical protein